MMRVALAFFVLSLFSFSTSFAAEPVVLIQHNGQYMGYFKQPRLSDVVVAANKSKDLYWPAASFYSLDLAENAKLEQKKQQVLARLADLKFYFQQEGDTELVSSITKLSDELASFQYSKKILLPLDPDVIRPKVSLNPLVDPGHYLLVVNTRPEKVAVYGLAQQQILPLLNASPLTSYVESLSLLSGASSSFVYLLPPDAKPLIAKTGLWNSSYQAVPPGAALFIPFEQRHLPSQFEDINDQIVELLADKVVAQ
jgi:hypothetical protein